MVFVVGVQMFSGLDPAADGWALREVTDLCGLTLGHLGGVEDDPAGPEASPEGHKPVRDRQHLRVVSSHRSLP